MNWLLPWRCKQPRLILVDVRPVDEQRRQKRQRRPPRFVAKPAGVEPPMGSALAVGSIPSTSRAADGRQHDDGHGGHADEAAVEAAAGYDGHDEDGGVDGDDGEDDDGLDVAVVAELAGSVELLLTDEGTVIATDAAFPSAFNCFASNSIQQMPTTTTTGKRRA